MHEPNTTTPHVFPEGRKPGELLFGMLMLLLAGALLAVIPWQTSWIPNKGLAAQPRLWPALSLGGSALFALLHIFSRNQLRRTPGRWTEAFIWVKSVEFIGWYMLYVASIPVIGYLLATVLFCVLLTLRVGYRGRPVFFAALFGLCVVLFFKSAMNVKIPAGAIYEYAPEGLRYILIRFF